MNTYKIYKWTNLITGMSYVGQTKRPLEKRAGSNMSGYRGCDKFWEAIQHYGTDCWGFEILWDGLTLDEANVYEEVEITDNETLYPYGYNLKTGGLNGVPSPETRKKLSENNPMKRPEVRAKNSTAKKGRKHTQKDKKRKIKKFAPEHRKKLSENNAMKHSEKHRKKNSEAKLGMSQEHLIFLIQWYSGWGWSQRRVARELRISVPTIRKYAKLANVKMIVRKDPAARGKRISESRLGMSQEAFTILVVWLLRDRWSQRRIARELRISVPTVRKYAKLGK